MRTLLDDDDDDDESKMPIRRCPADAVRPSYFPLPVSGVMPKLNIVSTWKCVQIFGQQDIWTDT